MDISNSPKNSKISNQKDLPFFLFEKISALKKEFSWESTETQLVNAMFPETKEGLVYRNLVVFDSRLDDIFYFVECIFKYLSKPKREKEFFLKFPEYPILAAIFAGLSGKLLDRLECFPFEQKILTEGLIGYSEAHYDVAVECIDSLASATERCSNNSIFHHFLTEKDFKLDFKSLQEWIKLPKGEFVADEEFSLNNLYFVAYGVFFGYLKPVPLVFSDFVSFLKKITKKKKATKNNSNTKFSQMYFDYQEQDVVNFQYVKAEGNEKNLNGIPLFLTSEVGRLDTSDDDDDTPQRGGFMRQCNFSEGKTHQLASNNMIDLLKPELPKKTVKREFEKNMANDGFVLEDEKVFDTLKANGEDPLIRRKKMSICESEYINVDNQGDFDVDNAQMSKLFNNDPVAMKLTVAESIILSVKALLKEICDYKPSELAYVYFIALSNGTDFLCEHILKHVEIPCETAVLIYLLDPKRFEFWSQEHQKSYDCTVKTLMNLLDQCENGDEAWKQLKLSFFSNEYYSKAVNHTFGLAKAGRNNDKCSKAFD